MKSPLKRVKKVPHIWFSGQRDLYMCPLEVGEGNRTSDVSNHFNWNIVLQVKSDRSSKFASNLHLAACFSQFSSTNTQTQIQIPNISLVWMYKERRKNISKEWNANFRGQLKKWRHNFHIILMFRNLRFSTDISFQISKISIGLNRF